MEKLTSCTSRAATTCSSWTRPHSQRARLHRRAEEARRVHRLSLAAVLHSAGLSRAQGLRPRHRDAVLGDEARHRHRPPRGPVRVLPELRRHGRGIPRARRRGQPAPRGQPHRLRARHLPSSDAIDEAAFFHHRLFDAGLPSPGSSPTGCARSCPPRTARAPSSRSWWAASWRPRCSPVSRTSAASPRDQANLGRLRRRLRRSPMIEVPQLDADVHDLHGLRLMDEYLFG